MYICNVKKIKYSKTNVITMSFSLPELNNEYLYMNDNQDDHIIKEKEYKYIGKYQTDNLLQSVNDDEDKKRGWYPHDHRQYILRNPTKGTSSVGRRIIDDIYVNLDGISADDFVIERSMMVKWLLVKYANIIKNVHKPVDIMFVILECIINGLQLFFTTDSGCYIDRVQILNGNIYCPCNEWILGFVNEKRKISKDTHQENRNVYECDEDVNYENDNVSNNNLPHIPYFVVNDLDEINEHHSCEDRQSQIDENTTVQQQDIEMLRKTYNSLLNIIDDRNINDKTTTYNSSSKTNRKHQQKYKYNNIDDDDEVSKYENVLTLIVDMEEMELLITYLLYIDRESIYGDIDINFHDKFNPCYIKNKIVAEKIGKCLQKNQISNIYENLIDESIHTDNNDNNNDKYHNDGIEDECGQNIPNNNDDDQYRENRQIKIIEYLTLLQLDKLITTIIGHICLGYIPTTEKNPYKFGLIDILCPKITKLTYNTNQEFSQQQQQLRRRQQQEEHQQQQQQRWRRRHLHEEYHYQRSHDDLDRSVNHIKRPRYQQGILL